MKLLADKIKLDERVLDYIKRELKKGFPEEQIVSMLNRAGYDLRIIEQHFEHIVKRKKIKKISISTLIIFLIIFVTFYFYTSEKNKFYKSKFENTEEVNDIVKSKFNLAKKYYIKRELGKSLNQFKDLTKLMPNDPRFYFYLGNIYCQKKDYALAIENYEKAINLNKNNPFYYFAMARCFEKQGFHEKALEILNASLYINLDSATSEDIS